MNPRSSHVFRLRFRSISHFALRKLIKFSSKLFIDFGKGATRSLEEFEINAFVQNGRQFIFFRFQIKNMTVWAGYLHKVQSSLNRTASLSILKLAERFIDTFMFLNYVKRTESLQCKDIRLIESNLLQGKRNGH